MAMDLNELLHEHQASVMRAAAAGNSTDQDNHFAKVAEYARRVRALREVQPVTNPRTPGDGPPTIIYGSYAGANAEPAAPAPAANEPASPAPAATAPVASWEDEGGAVRHPETPVPEGIDSKTVREYRVGPYVYQDLDLAVAEHMRQLAQAGKAKP